MKIAIMSDTLVTGEECTLSPALLEKLEGVNAIVHAGNICNGATLRRLQEIAPLEAVRGTLDDLSDPDIAALPMSRLLSIGDHEIGIYHEKPPMAVAKDFGIDILVHGGTCIPRIEETAETRLVIDPGSPTRPVKYKNGTFVLLKIIDQMLFTYVVKV